MLDQGITVFDGELCLLDFPEEMVYVRTSMAGYTDQDSAGAAAPPAHADPDLCVMGLEQGADDYVLNPFEPRELVACVYSILHRPLAPNCWRGNIPLLSSVDRRITDWRR